MAFERMNVWIPGLCIHSLTGSLLSEDNNKRRMMLRSLILKVVGRMERYQKFHEKFETIQDDDFVTS